MDLTHLHLLMNHLPVWGTILTFFFIVYSFYKKNIEFLKIFLGLFIFLALITIPVFLTGDVVDETVKYLPGVSESIIENHETAGWVSLIVMEVSGAFAIAGILLIRKKGNVAAWYKYSFTILMIVCIASFTWAAYLGGQIRHPEIRSDSNVEKLVK